MGGYARWVRPMLKLLYADSVTSIGTSVTTITVPNSKTGKYVEVTNIGSTNLVFMFDADPATGMQIPLAANGNYYGDETDFTTLRIKSDATGGTANVIIKGV